MGRLPLSKSAARQALHRKVIDTWKSEWASSPRHHKLMRIDGSLPSGKFLQLTSGLTRRQVTLSCLVRPILLIIVTRSLFQHQK